MWPATRLRSAARIRSPSEPPAMRIISGTTRPSQPNPPITFIVSAAIPATMNATPRTSDARGEPGSSLSASFSASSRVGGVTSTSPPARTVTSACSSPRIRAFAASLAWASSAAADTAVSCRRDVACRVYELAGSRPLSSLPLLRLTGRAAPRGPLAWRRDQPAAAPCGPPASRTARGTSLASARDAGREGETRPVPGTARSAGGVAAAARCQGAPCRATTQPSSRTSPSGRHRSSRESWAPAFSRSPGVPDC